MFESRIAMDDREASLPQISSKSENYIRIPDTKAPCIFTRSHILHVGKLSSLLVVPRKY